jgi:hypothetical protein
MSRKKGPALYELLSTNTPSHSKKPERVREHTAEEDVNLTHNVLTPGRSIRMSIGTIGVIVAVGIALIVISYTMGFQRGSVIAKEDYGNRLFEEVPPNTSKNVDTTSNSVQIPTKQPAIRVAGPSWGAITSDPRVDGENYFTLIQTTKEGAVQLAAFCREKGLETYAISGNNTRLYRVIALPGSVDRNDAIAAELRSKIYAIGQEWATTNEGRGSDLKDAYQSLYKK